MNDNDNNRQTHIIEDLAAPIVEQLLTVGYVGLPCKFAVLAIILLLLGAIFLLVYLLIFGGPPG